MTFLRPFRYINYVDEYERLLFNHYAIKGPKYFCTYYKFDIDNSIIDDRTNVQSGSYHILGEKSGRKWKKIQFVPMWQIEPHAPVTYQAKEEGVVRELETTFILPDYVGIRPTPMDFIHIFDNTANVKENNSPLYIVINKSESHVGKRKIYKVHCNNYGSKVNDLDVPQSISSEWIYVNHFRKIFSYDMGELILQSLNNNFELFDSLNKDEDFPFKYDPNLCMFITNK